LNESKTDNQSIDQQVKKLVDENKSLIEKSQKLTQSIQDVTETGKNENSNYLKILESLQEIKARKKVLQNMEQEHAGFFEGAKNILNNSQQIGGIVGAVAELITVPKDYQLAIETVVSNQLQSIVTEDETAAKSDCLSKTKSRWSSNLFTSKYHSTKKYLR
jgi:Chromosome segregation ATPases